MAKLSVIKTATLLAIDPGACSGWALFRAGQLTEAGVASPDHAGSSFGGRRFDVVVIEIPNAHEKRNAAPSTVQDLFTLCVRAGRLIERARPAKVRYVLPSAWKGQIDKEVCAKRVLRTLSEAELACIPAIPLGKIHNCYDAIGIGLYALGRFGR
jgi:hypothetical protein